MVGIVNAVNLIDGLDGLATGIAISATLVLFGVAFVDHAVLLCLLTAALGGSLIGFLFFNFNPARIFLGDSGSMFIGFLLASISIWTQRKGATAMALLIPVLALGIPILDTATSFVRRISRRQSPFRADREHVHHRLLDLGLSHRNAVLTLYTASAVLALGALALLDGNVDRQTIVLLSVSAAIFIFLRRVGVLGSKPREDLRVLRDRVRQAGRQIRRASSVDNAWDHVEALNRYLPFQSIRLVVFEDRHVSGEKTFHAPLEAHVLENDETLETVRVPLVERGRRYGELIAIPEQGPARPSELRRFCVELLAEALIDGFVSWTRESMPSGQVVSLAARRAGLNSSRPGHVHSSYRFGRPRGRAQGQAPAP